MTEIAIILLSLHYKSIPLFFLIIPLPTQVKITVKYHFSQKERIIQRFKALQATLDYILQFKLHFMLIMSKNG